MVHHLLRAIAKSAVKSTLRATIGSPIQAQADRLEANALARKKTEEEEREQHLALLRATIPEYGAVEKEVLRRMAVSTELRKLCWLCWWVSIIGFGFMCFVVMFGVDNNSSTLSTIAIYAMIAWIGGGILWIATWKIGEWMGY